MLILNTFDSCMDQASKSKSSKGAAKAAPAKRGRIVEAWNWDSQRIKLINTLHNTVQVPMLSDVSVLSSLPEFNRSTLCFSGALVNRRSRP